MKSIWCTIWILSVLLVMATLDAQPDPPAVNPSAVCKILQTHAPAGDAVAQPCDAHLTSYSFGFSFNARDAYEPHRLCDRIVLTVQAADPSPPAPRSARKPSIQS